MTNIDVNEIEINGITYIPKSSAQMAQTFKGYKYCIIRTYSAGVFAGYLKSLDGQEAIVLNARRIWYWEGAASLSQLAVDGTSKPDKCKFPAAVSEVILTQAIEVIPTTEKAKQSIEAVKIWTV